ncbi:conserved hypothetical protein [Uncinocarpus reesii 1704]|uniref:DUF7053 domain-containing protein n=1 Tax=Uncinocarpus reesii (strain UAMH 1704) TaxID=336963 RepID=C4JUV4_UNCRE|nr:uncharacterized protein UREG_04907 [Uncinocarpus reesii 1704]EEP80065.1 conserved hypothetical protein [Uncinocarpus reesii 1704]
MAGMMSKRSVFTTVTPLPPYLTRETVIETLHQHSDMIQLNPLVIKHERCNPPPNAPADEFHCIWYELMDKIHYLPGGMLSGHVSYKACFYDLPRGLQTHVYAPTGLDIKDKWSICGNMPGEPREPVELGLTDAPREGLYLREDVDMRCNIFVTSFVKKTLRKAHAVLVERLVVKADILKQRSDYASSVRHSLLAYPPTETDSYRSSWQSPTSPGFRVASPDVTSQISPSSISPTELHFQGRGSSLVLDPAQTGPFPPTQYSKPTKPNEHIYEIDGAPVQLPEITVEQVDDNAQNELPASSVKRKPTASQPGQAELA